MSEELAREVVEFYARHYGIPPPNVKVGCGGCPYYVGGRCVLGYIACYQPDTDTIVFSSPSVIREEVVLHELLHYALDIRGGLTAPASPLGVTQPNNLVRFLIAAGIIAIAACVYVIKYEE